MTKKINHVYQIWCEYDIGQDSVVFSTEQAAMTYAHRTLTEQGFQDVDMLENEGLLNVEELELL